VNLELEKLIELQKTDSKIRSLKKAIQSADQRRASIEQEFEQHAFEIREIQNKSESAKAERAELEKQIAENKTYLERAERNLKNSHNQKEYETAMREADALQKQISGLEGQVLEKMTAVEEVENVLAERSDEVSSLEGNRRQALADFEAELSANRTELETLTAGREEVFKTLPKQLASVYDRLAQRSRDGIAVAEVKNGSCSACFMKLRPQVQVEIKMSDKIITCESCTRILYILKDKATA
jgi:uncharacterized protein